MQTAYPESLLKGAHYVIHAISVQQTQLQGSILFIHQNCYAFNKNILTLSVG